MKRLISALLMAMCLLGASNATAFFPTNIKDIVTFIYARNPEGQIEANGTGFFVGVKNEDNSGRFNVYLVTAKHLLQDANKNYYDSIYIRLNTKGGDSAMMEVPLKGQGLVHFHQDIDVDLAVIPLLPDQSRFDFKFLPADMLTTKEIFQKYNIGEGDEMFFTGLFTPYAGVKRNYPIFRFGHLAMVMDEKIAWANGNLVDSYLMETQSFGGNSGSPVFFYLNPSRDPDSMPNGSQPILLLAGIMDGSFDEGYLVRTQKTNNVPVLMQNIGISTVIPAYKLYEILYSDALKNLRREGR